MKRGFFNSNGSKSSSQTLVTHGPLPPPASSISLASKAQTCNINTLTLNSANTDEPLIKVKDDQTVTWEESPLILLADSRIEDSPYFGYFPPNSRTPEMVIIHQDLESIEQAANWEIWKKPALKQKEKIELAFEIKPSEGKGMAMIARRDIAMGELIHAERPICVILQTHNVAPDQGHTSGDFYRSALSRLGHPQQQAILNLSNCWGEMKDIIPGILATNYLPADLTTEPNPDKVYCACFPTISRANHSCAPNANYFFQFADFTGRLYATRHIKAGEEITIMYCDLLQTQEQRREALYRSHRFVCTCDFCLGPATSIQTKNSNHNRVFIKRIIEKLADSSNVEKVDINDMRKAILMSEQEALICSKAQLLYIGGASLLVRSREEAREGLQWLHQAKILYRILEGKDSYHVEEIKHYIG